MHSGKLAPILLMHGADPIYHTTGKFPLQVYLAGGKIPHQRRPTTAWTPTHFIQQRDGDIRYKETAGNPRRPVPGDQVSVRNEANSRDSRGVSTSSTSSSKPQPYLTSNDIPPLHPPSTLVRNNPTYYE